jgi:ribose/xylose/arabinose/galactoside ABC-type transport system permease subunit
MGINVARHLTITYTLCGVLCGVAGVLTVAQFGVASPNAGGERALLNAVAATVIGGASLFGGRGNVGGTVLGAVIVGSTVTGLVLMSVTPYWQTIVIGVVIVLAVYVQRLGELGGARLFAAQASEEVAARRQPVDAVADQQTEGREVGKARWR